LEEWGNVSQRLEPRRIRTLEDRSLDRFKVRMADSTAQIVEFAATVEITELGEVSDLA